QRNPALLDARVALAYALISARQPKSAVELLDQTPEDQKRMTQVVVARNGALLALRDSTEARKGIDRGMAQSKDSGLTLQDAVLKVKRKDYTTARTSVETVLKENPENEAALEILAQTYIEQGQAAVAAQKLQQY